MNTLRARLGCAAATVAIGVLAFVHLAEAQTPDGTTPADETVCSRLADEGITKGLYGLCVAFCEAQDLATDFVTRSEFYAILESVPSGRILENYNKKKAKAENPLDPEMPCLRVEEPCPCFSQEELESIDGLRDDNGAQIPYQCDAFGDVDPSTQRHEGVNDLEGDIQTEYIKIASSLSNSADPSSGSCYYQSRSPGVSIVRRGLSNLQPDHPLYITPEEAAACLAAQQIKCGF